MKGTAMTEESNRAETIPGTLDQIKKQSLLNAMRLERLELGHRMLKKGQEEIVAVMTENTQMTQDIKDLLVAGKVGTKVIKWLGAVSIAITGIGTLIYQVFHHGKTPGG
jgi:hypothetical protein